MVEKKNETGLTYKYAGVNIDAGDALIEAIKPDAKRTMRAGANPSLGGFGGLFDLKRQLVIRILCLSREQ